MFGLFKKKKKEKKEYQFKIISNFETIAKHYDTNTTILQNALFEIEYIQKNGFWIIATEKGKQNGAIQKYNETRKKKHVIWNEKILHSNELKEKIREIKEKSKKITQKEKVIKGRDYELFIIDYFRSQGWKVWDHSGEKGKKDAGIDIIMMKDRIVYFVQCKNWEKWKITQDTVLATRTKVREYLQKENPTLWELIKPKKYTKKILYIVANDVLNAGAKRHIQENSDILEYRVIPMKD